VVRTALCLPFSPLAASLLVVIGSTPVFAQATVPPAGEGDVTLTYQNYYVTGHFDAGGRKNKNGATHTQAVLTEFDYALTDEVGLGVTLPFIAPTGRASMWCSRRLVSGSRVAGRLRSHALCLRRCTRDFRVPGDEEHARRRGGTCRNVACEPQSCFELAIPAYGAEAARPSAHLGGT
jgi:hypothetical protein